MSPNKAFAQPVVEALSICKTYRNGTQALAPTDFTLHPGDFVSLIGPSGCGKSTLLKLVAGLLEPSDGRLLWWRERSLAQHSSGKRLAFVFQEATLMPWATVEANVRLPLDLHHVPRDEACERVGRALARVGLSRYARHRPRELSGGMQMRVSIARALVTDPDLLLMDEPFGALDEITRNRLDEDLRQLWVERGLSIMFVTHSVYEAAFLSSRVVVMAARPGRIFSEMAIDHAGPRDAHYRASAFFADATRALSDELLKASLASSADPLDTPAFTQPLQQFSEA
jgi:NitT/TauT family transport system ATP-binding protein